MSHPDSLDPWAISEHDFPASGGEAERLRFLVRYALLAPSTRNTQPWKFRIGADEVGIFVDPARWERIADADQREMYISAGCALENLVIAAAHFGYRPTVEILPDAGNVELAARVRLERGEERPPVGEDHLFAAIPRRFTNHGVYDGTPVDEHDLAALHEPCAERGASLVWTNDDAARLKIDELVLRADALLLSQPEYRQELGALIGTGVFGTPWLIATLGRLAVSYLMPVKSFAKADHRTLTSSPAFGLICAQENSREAQVRVGQALERAYLAATDLGLCLQPVSQLLQAEETRAALAAMLPAGGGVPLQPFRLGRATPPREHTPRRPIEEVLL